MTLNLKHILGLLIILTFSVKLKAQDKTIDSLKQALKIAKHDTTRCNILNELIEVESDDKIWPVYNEQLLKLCEKCLASTAAPPDHSGNTPKAFYLKQLAGALNNIGYLADRQGNSPQALEYFHKCLKIQEEIKDKEGIANSLNNIGFINNNQGDIPKALECFHKSLKIREEIKDKSGIAYSLNNIGMIYNNQGDIPKALEYYHKSLKIKEEIKDKEGIALSLNNIGFVYNNQGDIPKALEYYHKSLKIREEIKDKQGIALSLNNIGMIYNNQGDIPKALEYLHKSLKIREEIKDKSGIATSLNNIASAMLQQGSVGRALDYATRSVKVSKELGYPEQVMSAATVLKKIYKKQNKFKEAFEMYELEIQMRDSINNAETKKASIRKQFQYQYEKRAAADSVKNAEEQKVKNAQLSAQTAQLKQERTQRLALYGGLVLVIAFSGFVFNRFRLTQKQKKIIELQKQEVDSAYEKLHEKNKEVMDSIRYARRIQNSLFTTEKYIANSLDRLTKRRQGL